MKIVIDMEEGRYNWIMSHASKHPYDYADASDLFFRTAVERGIVLPNENEGDLISREALKEEMQKADIKANDYETLAKMYENCVDNALTVSFMISPDYVTELQNLNKELTKQLEETERSHGEWVFHTYMPHKPYCSMCEKDSPYGKLWDFCPNCGAKMEGGVE